MRISLLLGLTVLVVFAGCSGAKMPSVGEWNNIIVFSEDAEWSTIQGSFKEYFEREIITPQREILFKIYRNPISNFKVYQNRRFVVVAAALDGNSRMAAFLAENLTEEMRQQLQNGTNVFIRENEWARQQVAVYIIAETAEKLKTAVQENGDRIFSVIDEWHNRYLKDYIYDKMEQVDLEEELYEEFGFSLRIQHDYFLKKDPDNKYIILRRYEPDRFFFVHWIDTTGVQEISPGWLLENRRRLAEKYLDNRIIDSEVTTVGNVQFLDYLATEIRGLWYKPGASMGGYLANYTFFDEKTSRIYMIDMQLFAPQFVAEKEPFIRQMEVIAQTFSTSDRDFDSFR